MNIEILKHSRPGSLLTFLIPKDCNCKSDKQIINENCITVYKSNEGIYYDNSLLIDRSIKSFYKAFRRKYIK